MGIASDDGGKTYNPVGLVWLCILPIVSSFLEVVLPPASSFLTRRVLILFRICRETLDPTDSTEYAAHHFIADGRLLDERLIIFGP
jgi:hypothetical protein